MHLQELRIGLSSNTLGSSNSNLNWMNEIICCKKVILHGLEIGPQVNTFMYDFRATKARQICKLFKLIWPLIPLIDCSFFKQLWQWPMPCFRNHPVLLVPHKGSPNKHFWWTTKRYMQHSSFWCSTLSCQQWDYWSTLKLLLQLPIIIFLIIFWIYILGLATPHCKVS